MNLSRLRLITFDVTDTLLKFRTSPGKQYGEVGAMYGILADTTSLTDNFKHHWRKMNKDHPNFGRKSGLGWENWWKSVVKGTFKDSKIHVDDHKLDSIAKHLIEVYQTSLCWQQSYGALGLLSYLRNRGIPMGIISNFDPRLGQTLVNTRLRHYFNFVLTSYEFGEAKPHPDIFKQAMLTSNINELKPEHCLHIGNTALLDYMGAKNSGWNAILIHEKHTEEIREKHSFVDAAHMFGNLYDLHKHLIEVHSDQVDAQCC